MNYKQPVFNLELMKLATYYKQRNDLVKLAPMLEPERYTKFFFRKDWDDGNYPKQMFEKNVSYGGYAFNSNYYPLAEEIEATPPDTYIYEPYRKFFTTTPMLNAFSSMERAAHIRLSLDNKTVWPRFHSSFETRPSTKIIFFHDYDLNKIAGAKETVLDIYNENIANGDKRWIGMKFPVQTDNTEDFVFWMGLQGALHFFSIQYNGMLGKESFQTLLNSRATQTKNLDCIVTAGCSEENEFLEKRLPIIFKQLLNSQIHYKRISLKYEDGFFKDQKWEHLLQLLNDYNSAIIGRQSEINPITFHGFIKSLYMNKWGTIRARFPREYVIDLFQFVREKNYEVFKMFYEYTGGEIDYDTDGNT